MSSPTLEAFLARLYADEAALAAFLTAPDTTAKAAGLDPETVAALAAIDRDGLVMAARSFRAKRTAQAGAAGRPSAGLLGKLARPWRR